MNLFNSTHEQIKTNKKYFNAFIVSFLSLFIGYIIIAITFNIELFKFANWFQDKNNLDQTLNIRKYLITITNALIFTGVLLIPLFILQVKWIKKRKELQEQGRLLNGFEVVKDKTEFKKKILNEAKEGAKKAEASFGKLPAFYTPRLYLTAEELPFFKDSETKQLLFIGAAGAGKTVAIWDYITKLILWEEEHKQPHTWIVYDMKWDFWTKLFRSGIDRLFLPTHKETLKWNWFDEFLTIDLNFIENNGDKRVEKFSFIGEAQKAYLKAREKGLNVEIDKHVDNGALTNLMLGFSPIPVEESSKKWVAKGRKALEASFITVAIQSEFPSPADYIDFINQFNTREAFVARIVELGIARKYRAIAIESITGGEESTTEAGQNGYENFMEIATDLNKVVYYHKAIDCDFSVKMLAIGMKDQMFDMRVFMCQDPNNEEEYTTVFTAMLVLMSKAIISLPSNLERRIIMLLDEVASLKPIPEILNNLPERARSRGISMIIGLQSFATFIEKYTEIGMERIMANIKTRIFMNVADNITIPWIQKNLGENEWLIENESIADNNGSSLSSSIHKRPVLSNLELKSLAPLEAYFQTGSYLYKTFYADLEPQKIAEYEHNEDMPKVLNMDFEKANKQIHNIRRKKVADTMIWLMKNTNQDINVKNISKKSGLIETKVKEIVGEFNEERTQVINACTQIQATNIDRSNEVLVHKVLEKITGLDLEDIKPFIPEGFIKPKEAKKASKAKEVKEEKVVAEEIEECPLSESEMEELNNYYDPKVTSMEDLIEDLMS